MIGVDPEAFKAALSRVDDGKVFEQFALRYMSAVQGYEFLPVGGLKDRAIDGLEHAFYRTGYERYIYQITIEKDSEGKLAKTIAALESNGVIFDQLYFITNQEFPNKDIAVDSFFDTYKKPLHIRDIDWLAKQVNSSVETVNIYHTFVDSYLHEFSKPGKAYVISDLVDDPRLFVFLRQQWDEHRGDLDLDEVLADTLILFALEGTDPDRNILMTADEIKLKIASQVTFEVKQLHDVIERRLEALSKRPHRINYHTKEKAFCLPYATRSQIADRNITDAALHQRFLDGVENRLKVHLGAEKVRVKDYCVLIETTINKIFHQQGLEFADFILSGDNPAAVERSLADVIADVVDGSAVIMKNRNVVKTCLLMTIRDIVYSGTADEQEFLRRLSNTYMMLFLLQCDPKIATFFHSMAAKLEVYVCTSLLIPALSEYFIAPQSRRHWNLLKGAHAAGVKLLVNETIIRELVAHFKRIKNKYVEQLKSEEDFYLTDELCVQYVDEILLRAYLYARIRKRIDNFDDFLDNFVSSNLEHAEDELLEWLRSEFGIAFRAEKSLGITIDGREEQTLFDELRSRKGSDMQARNDTRLILTMFGLREKNNERDAGGILGYRTWWLSKDTTTFEAVRAVLGYKYSVSCYMRPDFLCNYISLAPTKPQVDRAFHDMFPSMLGINISVNLPKEVSDVIHKEIRQHRDKNPTRLRSILHDLAERLKADPDSRTRNYVQDFFKSKESERGRQ